MRSPSICIVARPMSWLATRRPRFAFVLVLGLIAATGCDDLDGRASNRKGNRMFRDGRFIDAVVLYEQALTKVQDPRIEYNIGLGYSRVFKGTDEPVLLGQVSETVCSTIPGVTTLKSSVCVKNKSEDEDRSYPSCKSQDDCPSSATCKIDLEMCAISNKQLADLTQLHLTKWISTQPADDQIQAHDKELTTRLGKLEDKRDAAEARAESYKDPKTGKLSDKDAYESAMNEKTSLEEELKALREEIEENRLKFTMRTLMTNVLVDSGQHDKALAYWQGELDARPNDFEAMGKLAGINLKAGNWRKAIEWYGTIAEKVPEPSNKVSAYSSIGNVAWAKLNSKQLTNAESVELADRGIGALQKAAEIQPKNTKLVSLQASIFNFRSLAQGVSWAAGLDRASAQDLQHRSRVLRNEAKKAQGLPTTPAPAPATTNPAPGESAGGESPKTGG